MPLLALRLIDVAIFGSLGALWIGGLCFIVLLYRWILGFERGREPADPTALPVAARVEPVAPPPRPARRVIPQAQPAPAREALAAR